jgi:hypothetical protein
MVYHYDNLTLLEKEMAESQLLSIYEDWAYDGDEFDKKLYEELLNDKEYRVEKLKSCGFVRDGDYISLLL